MILCSLCAKIMATSLKNKGSTETDEPTKKCPSKLTLEDLKLVKVLGIGGFGKIFLAEEKATNKLYALKIQKKSKFGGEHQAANPFMERKVLALASNSDFLVSLRSCFQTPDRIFFVMEYCIGGDLSFHMKGRRFTEGEVRFYAAEMVLAIQFLHRHDIIHRDISLNNFLLDIRGHIKLTDFGLCTEVFAVDSFRFQGCGKRPYSAPELIQGGFYGKSVDWWALGVCLYIMLIRRYPFEGKDKTALAHNIAHSKLEIPSGLLHLQSIDLLERLLCKDVRLRLGCNTWGLNTDKAVFSHSFFRGVDWTKMKRQELRPPIVPKLAYNLDTRYFSMKNTRLPAEITPIGEENKKHMAKPDLFVNFSFVNENFTDPK